MVVQLFSNNIVLQGVQHPTLLVFTNNTNGAGQQHIGRK